MKLIKLVLLILVIVINIAGCKNIEVNEPVAAVVGKVVKVVDGDTLHVYNSKGTYKIRLSGIDAPERGQAYGKRAKEHLQKLVGGKQVIAIVESKDRYGRYVASVKCQSRDVCAEMLQAGYAWHYKQYDNNKYYTELQREARRAKRGLWVEKKPQAPWDYRKEQRAGL
ncbi:MAG: thermonuclease family protein [Phascolarctobacterium sp.]|nr:thermonuclease family protein [Phascolarctobacterium sp.]